eukprot:1260987-Lingulodinium_polyedra.AAC.1
MRSEARRQAGSCGRAGGLLGRGCRIVKRLPDGPRASQGLPLAQSDRCLGRGKRHSQRCCHHSGPVRRAAFHGRLSSDRRPGPRAAPSASSASR